MIERAKKFGPGCFVVKCLMPHCGHLLELQEKVPALYKKYCEKSSPSTKEIPACIICMQEEKAVLAFAGCEHKICRNCAFELVGEVTKHEILVLTDYDKEEYQDLLCPMRQYEGKKVVPCAGKVKIFDVIKDMNETEIERYKEAAKFKRLERDESKKDTLICHYKMEHTLFGTKSSSTAKLVCFKCGKETDVRKLRCKEECSFATCNEHAEDALKGIVGNGICIMNMRVGHKCTKCGGGVYNEIMNLNKQIKRYAESQGKK